MARKTMSPADVRAETLRVFRAGGDADEIHEILATDHLKARRILEPYLDPLLDLLVEVYVLAGASREQPIRMEGFAETYLGDYEFRGKVDHRNLHYALTYPALVHGGLEPDVGGDLHYWNSEVWPYVLYAIVAYLRVAAERTGRTVPESHCRKPPESPRTSPGIRICRNRCSSDRCCRRGTEWTAPGPSPTRRSGSPTNCQPRHARPSTGRTSRCCRFSA